MRNLPEWMACPGSALLGLRAMADPVGVASPAVATLQALAPRVTPNAQTVHASARLHEAVQAVVSMRKLRTFTFRFIACMTPQTGYALVLDGAFTMTRVGDLRVDVFNDHLYAVTAPDKTVCVFFAKAMR